MVEIELTSPKRLRLWAICIFLCLGTGLPFFCTLYIPNTAQNSMQAFIYRSVLANGQPNASSPTELGASEEKDVSLSLLWSVFIAEMAMGQLIGYVIASPLVDGFGRKHSLLIAATAQIPAQLCHILAQPLDAWPLLYVGRVTTMLIFAVTSVIVPVFLSEVATARTRGSIGTVFPVSLSSGALLGGVLGLNPILGSEKLWPIAFCVPLFCSIMIVPLIIFIPETPQFLAASGDLEGSRAALKFYQGTDSNFASVQADSHMAGQGPPRQLTRNLSKKPALSRTASTISTRGVMAKSGFRAMGRLLRKKSLRGPLILTIVIGLSFCCSGILVVSAYSTAILGNAGLDWHIAEYLTVALKVLSFATYILCLFLVDRVGRRPLMLTSIFGAALAWTVMVISRWMPPRAKSCTSVAVLFFAQFFMNIGVRPLFYVLVPELFPFEFRTAGKSMVALLGVTLTIPLLFGFWPLLKIMNEFVFLLQALPLWFCLLYLYKSCPETKGRNPAEIFQNIRVGSLKARHHPAEKEALNGSPAIPSREYEET